MGNRLDDPNSNSERDCVLLHAETFCVVWPASKRTLLEDEEMISIGEGYVRHKATEKIPLSLLPIL